MTNKDCILCEKSDYRVLYKASGGMRDVDPGVYRCTSTGHGSFGQIVKCNSCGLVYINPRRDDAEILKDYSEVVDDKYLNEKKYRLLTFNRSLELIKKYKKSGKILDIGCYIGTFLEAARQDGWDTYGVEPSRWAAAYARKELGLNVLEGAVEECSKFGTDFDVVTLWDSIEH
ncbi:MAG: class I SAM-dependent methyltransferase, partial [Candidatus Omnitrophota bacterium]|nr:class I SAM-dependent methyltransferase [Candidatus Omnitrophota bacterium]